MTKNFEHDQKIHTNEHQPSNLTKNIINITTTTNINVWIWPKLKKYIKTSKTKNINLSKLTI